MIIPTIHLNGTSKEQLIEEISEAIWKLRQAIQELEAIYPNGRDYYPQGENAYKQAKVEHDARIEKVKGVMNELDELRNKIDEGGHGHAKASD